MRGTSCTAHVRIKKGGVLVYQEFNTFRGRGAEALARDWATRLEARIKQDGVPQRELKVTTLGGLLQRYATTRGSIKPLRRSLEHELTQLSGHFESTTLASLKPKVFVEFAMKRRAEGAGPATMLHNLATIRSVLNAAKPMYDLEVNGDPVSEAIKALGQMKVVAKSTKRTRRPTPAELVRLKADFARIAAHPYTVIPMEHIMELAIELPRRCGELCNMLWADLKDNVITLRDTKNPVEPRTEFVPVLPAAAAIIAVLPVIDERILPYKPESVSASWQRACTRLGIVDLHFHDLRREGISRLFKAGYTIPEVSKISGHQSWDMLKIYTEINATDVLEKFQ